MNKFGDTFDYLKAFLSEFAAMITVADHRRPQKTPHTRKKPYQAGIGPFTEDETVDLVLAEFPNNWEGCSFERFVSYPAFRRSKCDLCMTTPVGQIYIEIKMMRLFGDNGKTNDNIFMHILSPYPKQRSALTDIQKLNESGFTGDKAIIIYGYNYKEYPMLPLVKCYETLAGSKLIKACPPCHYYDLIHPVHTEGSIYGWMLS